MPEMRPERVRFSQRPPFSGLRALFFSFAVAAAMSHAGETENLPREFKKVQSFKSFGEQLKSHLGKLWRQTGRDAP